MSGGSSSNQEKTTEITERTTTNIGDIGLTGKDIVEIQQAVSAATSAQSRQAGKTNRKQSDTLTDLAAEDTRQVKAAFNTAKALSGTVAKGFEALSNTSEQFSDTQRSISRTASAAQRNIAAQTGARPASVSDAQDANFGGMNIVTLAAIAGGIASIVSISRSF